MLFTVRCSTIVLYPSCTTNTLLWKCSLIVITFTDARLIQDRAFFSLSAGSRYHHLLLPVLTCGKPLFRRGSGALGLNERTDDRTYNAHVAATRPAPCLIFFFNHFFFFFGYGVGGGVWGSARYRLQCFTLMTWFLIIPLPMKLLYKYALYTLLLLEEW